MKIFAHFCLSATSVCGTRILSFINTCIAIDCRMRVDKRRGGGCRLTGSLVTVNDFRVEGVVGSSLLCPSGRISVSQNDGASSLTHPPLHSTPAAAHTHRLIALPAPSIFQQILRNWPTHPPERANALFPFQWCAATTNSTRTENHLTICKQE